MNSEYDTALVFARFVVYSAWLVILVAGILLLLLPLQGDVMSIVYKSTVAGVISMSITFCGFIAVACNYFLPYSKKYAYNLFTSMKLLFNLTLITFLCVISIWVVYLRGVLRSPFSALLCAFPVTFVVVAVTSRYHQSTIENEYNDVECDGKLWYAEVVTSYANIFLFFVAVIIAELAVRGVALPKAFVTAVEQFEIEPSKYSKLKENEWFLLTSYVSFYGSICSTLATFYSSDL